MLTLLLTTALALAITPAERIDGTLRDALLDLNVCPALAEGSRWRARWSFDGDGRASLDALVSPGGEAAPADFVTCAGARSAEVVVRPAAGWTWVRTATFADGRLTFGSIEVVELEASRDGACATEALARRPSAAGLLAVGLVAHSPGTEGVVLREELGDETLGACLGEAHVTPIAPADKDRLVSIALPVPLDLPDDRTAHAPLEAEAPTDRFLEALDRAYLLHALVAPPELLESTYRALCDGGFALACGWEAWHAPGSPIDLERLRVFEPACEAGDPVACVPLAWSLYHDAPGAVAGPGPDRDRAARLLADACDAGLLRACSELATLRDDPEEAAALLLEGCERGDGHACLHLGQVLLPTRPQRARAMLEHAVAAGEAAAWYELGRWWDEGHGGASDPPSAEEAWQRGCASGALEACDVLDARYQPDGWRGRNDVDGERWSEVGCEAGHDLSCFRLGAYRVRRSGRLTSSAAAFARACELGHAPGCLEEATLALLAPRDPGRSVDPVAVFEATCDPEDHEDWPQCRAAAHLRAGGALGTVSPDALQAALRKQVDRLTCTRYGEVQLGVALGRDGDLVTPPVVLSATADDAAVACAEAAFLELDLPRLRDGEVAFLRVLLDFETPEARVTFSPSSWSWASGRVEFLTKTRDAGRVALPALRRAVETDLGLGSCFDGSELYPAEFEMVVSRSGDSRRVRRAMSTGSDAVDACIERRLDGLRLPFPIDATTTVRLGVAP